MQLLHVRCTCKLLPFNILLHSCSLIEHYRCGYCFRVFHYWHPPVYCSWSSTYIQTLFSIMKVDMTKFLAVFLVYLVGFAGAFLLVLQVDRTNPAAVQEAGGVASASGGDGADNSTVYVCHNII